MTVLGFTRPQQRIRDSIKEAEDMGFTVMAAPSLDILPGEDSEFTKLEQSVGDGVTVIFGSGTAVEQCSKRFPDLAAMVAPCRVVSIGPNTTKELAKAKVRVDAEPEDYSSYGLVDLLKADAAGRRIVIIRSDSGSDVLSDGLKAAGADVIDVASYRLKEFGMSSALLHLLMSMKHGEVDVMAFTSPMSASSFIAALEKQFGKERAREYLGRVKVAAIGRPTAMRLESLGRKPDIIPEKTTFHDMLLAIKDASS